MLPCHQFMVASAETNQFLFHLVVRYLTESAWPLAITDVEMAINAIIVKNILFMLLICFCV